MVAITHDYRQISERCIGSREKSPTWTVPRTCLCTGTSWMPITLALRIRFIANGGRTLQPLPTHTNSKLQTESYKGSKKKGGFLVIATLPLPSFWRTSLKILTNSKTIGSTNTFWCFYFIPYSVTLIGEWSAVEYTNYKVLGSSSPCLKVLFLYHLTNLMIVSIAR